MKKFQFSLESVEKVRKLREDEALRALASAQSALQNVKEQKQLLLADLKEALIRREGLGVTPVTNVAFHIESEFITGTKQRIVQTETAIKRATRAMEKALRGYVNARRQTRMIEIIREKRSAEFRREQKKREEKELNDLYVMRATVKVEAL